MHGDISEVVVFPPNRGRIVCSCCCQGTGEYGIGRGSRPWKPFSQAGIAPASCDSYGRRGSCCWSYRPSRMIEASANIELWRAGVCYVGCKC